MLFLQIFIFSSESLISILVVEGGAVEGTSFSFFSELYQVFHASGAVCSILNGQHFAFSSIISPSSLICSCVFLIH
jgi:hypothetical protein